MTNETSPVAASPLREASALSLDELFARFDALTLARAHGQGAESEALLSQMVERLREQATKWNADEAAGAKRAKSPSAAKRAPKSDFDANMLDDI